MKLYEHKDFEQAVLQAAEHFRAQGIRPALIEKDYYVTEALRIIAGAVADKVIFKGGTSEVAGQVLVEAGTASGREPTVTVELHSYLGSFLAQRGVSLGAEDEAGFPMRLLHSKRSAASSVSGRMPAGRMCARASRICGRCSEGHDG